LIVTAYAVFSSFLLQRSGSELMLGPERLVQPGCLLFMSIPWIIFLLAVLQQPAASRGSIQGKVVRAGASAAGAPEQIENAQVELKPGNRSVSTDADGAFSFQGLPPGQYTIFVRHAGFIPLEDPRRGLTASGLNITVGVGQTLRDIVLPMIPAPVITGTVFDPNGQPLATALVRAYVRQYSVYGTRLRVVKKGMTDDMGEFRLFGLTFGQYFVSAGYSDRDRAEAIGRTQLSANVSKADDGYVTVFYDGAEELSAARPARLAPGLDPEKVNIYFKDPARFRIRGQLNPVINGTRIMFVPRGSDLAETHAFVQPNANGAFEIRSVSPGAYLMLANTADGLWSSDVIAVNVTDSDIDGLRLAMAQTVPVSGTLAWEGNPREDLSALHVKLVRSSVEFDQTLDAYVRSNGAFTFDHVSLSEYDINVEPLPPGTYVKTIRAAGRDVLAGARLLPSQPVQIVLATATDNLDVHVIKDSNPAAGAQVVLIPSFSLRRRPDRYLTGFTDASGNLHLSAVPPGGYTAYAFEQIEAGAYYGLALPGGDNRFRDRAASLTVGEGGTKGTQLRLIPAAETSGGLN
jgi:hypothetical protein